MPDYDVVVIGAGNGGLTSALGLAKNGLKVLLLERHNIPGGCATSFIRGRFEFEVALHQLSGIGTKDFPGPLRGALEDLGVIDKLELVQMENLYRVVVPGSMDINLKADRTSLVASLKERFPHEAKNIDAFFDLLYAYCTEWINVKVFKDPDISKDKYPLYFKYTLEPTKAIFDKFFTDPELEMVLGIYCSYLGMPLEKLTFGEFGIMLWAYIEFKPWHFKGGSQALSNALVDTFLEYGGEVRYNCGAKKINVSQGKVTGVVTENGDEISTNRVVSNAGKVNTYVDLIGSEHVPKQTMRRLGSKTIGTSFVSVFMGFDCEPAELGIDTSPSFIGTSNFIEYPYQKEKTLEAPEFCLFSCYDMDIPGFSPAGACQASLVSLSYAEPWLSIPPSQYFEKKYEYADKMLDLIEPVYPGIRNHIEEIDVATPLTHMRYLGHPGGAAYGFEQHAKDTNLFEDENSSIEGLFHVGAWSGVGGGFQPTLMSGYATAQKIYTSMKG